GSPLPKSDSIPAIRSQTGSVRPVTRSRRASPFRLLAILGGVGFFAILGIGAVLFMMLPGILQKPVTPVSTPTPSQVSPTTFFTSTPSQTPEPELGFTLVEPTEVLKTAADLKTLQELAVERYTDRYRNKINTTLTFTVNSKADVPVVWYWGWCAVDDKTLEQNLTQIRVVFEADGQAIAADRLAKETYEAADEPYKGWKCQGYLTILRDWKPGTYKLKETINFSSAINDGRDGFGVGYMISEYTVNISK
ncbi:MAG TPA: hypothetical protein VN653_12180, partial [Anaerolineales bacterium]|nr:hypothetical protein [Anaerolineales bacterium]